MTQNYFCYIRDKYGDCLTDGITDERLCILNSSDFPILIKAGYSIEILDFLDIDDDDNLLNRCLFRSHLITRHVLNHNNLPLIKIVKIV